MLATHRWPKTAQRHLNAQSAYQVSESRMAPVQSFFFFFFCRLAASLKCWRPSWSAIKTAASLLSMSMTRKSRRHVGLSLLACLLQQCPSHACVIAQSYCIHVLPAGHLLNITCIKRCTAGVRLITRCAAVNMSQLLVTVCGMLAGAGEASADATILMRLHPVILCSSTGTSDALTARSLWQSLTVTLW